MPINKPKLIRITTVSKSLKRLLKGQLHYMNTHGFEVIGVSSPDEFLPQVEKAENIPTYAVAMQRGISPLDDIKSVWNLYKIFKKEQPKIVHTHTPKAGTVGMFAAYLAGVPIRLHTVAGLPLMETKGIKRKILNNVEKITYQLATKVYPNSLNLKQFIIDEKLGKASKLKVIGNGSSNGIDTSVFDPATVSKEIKSELRDSLAIKPNDFVFLFIGRLVNDKGINELITAFVNLAERHADMQLVLVGNNDDNSDPLADETLEQIQNHPQIHAVGYKNNVVDYFAFADVFTFPSYREGFPNVVLQAAAMQLCSIVTNINGSNEIVEEGKNGFVIPLKDAENLGKKMKYCYQNKEQTKQMGFKSRRIILEKFERTQLWALIKKEYDSFL